MATLSIDERFAPLPADVQAILRAKTLLGETYIELTPGTADGPQLAEGATLSEAQVAQTVQIDEVLRTFDPKTRAALRSWLRDSAIAIDGRGQSLSQRVRRARRRPSRASTRSSARSNTQETAVRQLFANGAITFDALSRRRGELRSLIESSNTVLADDGPPRPGSDRDLPGLPDLPQRVAAHARPAAVVRAQRRSARRPARSRPPASSRRP